MGTIVCLKMGTIKYQGLKRGIPSYDICLHTSQNNSKIVRQDMEVYFVNIVPAAIETFHSYNVQEAQIDTGPLVVSCFRSHTHTELHTHYLFQYLSHCPMPQMHCLGITIHDHFGVGSDLL